MSAPILSAQKTIKTIQTLYDYHAILPPCFNSLLVFGTRKIPDISAVYQNDQDTFRFIIPGYIRPFWCKYP